MEKSEIIKKLPKLELPKLNSYFNIEDIDTPKNIKHIKTGKVNNNTKHPIKAQAKKNSTETVNKKKDNEFDFYNIDERQLLIDIYKKMDNIEKRINNN